MQQLTQVPKTPGDILREMQAAVNKGIGDYVEIQAGPAFPGWNGKRGHVTGIQPPGYLIVTVPDVGEGAWWPHHLILIDEVDAAKVVLGEDYFD